jgi:4'-phosphopantetheinyl transferase
VHLWRVELDVGANVEAKLRGELAPDELARADGLASVRARRRFVVARGALRVLLGDLLGERPRSIAIEAGASGKPRLAGGGRRLGFNVSHSGDLALICVAEGAEVGVDFERLRPVPDAVAIARRRFAVEEARFVEEGEPADVDRRFLACWTRKEAVAKAVGAGLSFDLRSFTVPIDEPRGIVSLDAPGGERAQRWSVFDIPTGVEHVSALALPLAAGIGGEGAAFQAHGLSDPSWIGLPEPPAP